MTLTLPVQDDQELEIVVLEHDPELSCISDSKVATHHLVTGVCPPHPLCIDHAEICRRWCRELIAEGDFPQTWVCGLHDIRWTARPSEFRLLPAGGSR